MTLACVVLTGSVGANPSGWIAGTNPNHPEWHQINWHQPASGDMMPLWTPPPLLPLNVTTEEDNRGLTGGFFDHSGKKNEETLKSNVRGSAVYLTSGLASQKWCRFPPSFQRTVCFLFNYFDSRFLLLSGYFPAKNVIWNLPFVLFLLLVFSSVL